MNTEDLDILSRTIYGEARGEPMQGKIAVAHVVLNRARKRTWFGSGVKGVCLKPWQFSCWNADDPNRAKIEAVTLDDHVLQQCFYAALAAGLAIVPDMTAGSTHYHTVKVHPDWADGKNPVCTIGVHKFYNDVE